MSSKEDAKEKKKKKKSAKPEGKAKEAAEEPVKEEADKGAEQLETAPETAAETVPETVSETTVEPEAAPEPPPAVEEPVQEPSQQSRSGSKKEEKRGVMPADLEKLMQLKEAFSLFDFNHDGIIDLQDLKYTFASLGKPDFPEEEMQKMLKEASEPCDFDAFVALFGYKVSNLDTEEVFTKALSTWDMRGIGMISEEKLKKDITCFGDKFTGKETDNALEEAPVYVNEGMPMIDYVKFSSNVCGFRNVERTRKYQKDLDK